MSTQSAFPLNNLILRIAGGQRDGESISVKTSKCFLSSDDGDEQIQCAIFRGPNGAAVRSYGDNLSVNGVAATVHWLKEGDQIKFADSMTFEVAQLGWLDASCESLDSITTKSDSESAIA